MEPRLDEAQEVVNDEGIFWTDMEQATERLVATWISYDGLPYYVQNILRDEGDGKLRIVLQGRDYKLTGKSTTKFLNAAKFNKFRTLPATGWMNDENTGRAKFLERLPRRNRQHGLNEQNTRLMTFVDGSLVADEGINRIAFTQGYQRACLGEYPSFRGTIEALEDGVAVAVSSKFCLYKDVDGLILLIRGKERIGVFTGKVSVSLLPSKKYFKEELENSPELRGINVGVLSYA